MLFFMYNTNVYFTSLYFCDHVERIIVTYIKKTILEIMRIRAFTEMQILNMSMFTWNHKYTPVHQILIQKLNLYISN